MTTFSVLKFNSPDSADQALATLQRLQQQPLIKVVEAAVLTWPKDSKGQAVNTTAVGAFGGAFWGMLFGMLFFLPLLGHANAHLPRPISEDALHQIIVSLRTLGRAPEEKNPS